MNGNPTQTPNTRTLMNDRWKSEAIPPPLGAPDDEAVETVEKASAERRAGARRGARESCWSRRPRTQLALCSPRFRSTSASISGGSYLVIEAVSHGYRIGISGTHYAVSLAEGASGLSRHDDGFCPESGRLSSVAKPSHHWNVARHS